MLFAVATFAVVLLIFLGVYWTLVLRPEGTAERQLKRRLKGGVARKVAAQERGSLVTETAPLSSLPILDRLLARTDRVAQPLTMLVERSGLTVTVGQLVLATAFAALLGFALGWYFTSQPLAGLLLMALFAYLPISLVRFAAARRIAKFEEQFPEAIDLIARALRAGHAFTTTLGMVAEEMPEPVRAEFQLLHDRQNYGMPIPDALRSFAERVPLLDARFFVTAVMTQREAGGNLAEVLDGLSALVRERFRLKRQVRVLSAHGRITGWVLAALPIVLSGILFLIAPAHISLLLTDPLGVRMVMIVAVLQVIGFFAMRRIVDIEI
jgi:tight adherence protein B